MGFKKIFLAMLLFSIFLNPMAFALQEENKPFCSLKKGIVTGAISALCVAGLGYSVPKLVEASKNTILACVPINSNDQNLLQDDPVCLNGSKLGPLYTSDVVDQSGQPVNYHVYNETDYYPCVGELRLCCQNSTVACRMSTFPSGIKVMDPYVIAKSTPETAGMIALAVGSTGVALCTLFICATDYWLLKSKKDWLEKHKR